MMPTNLLKIYNQHLDIIALNPAQRNTSLRGIFNRDIVNNENFAFRAKPIKPTTKEGYIPMDTLFAHLTTHVEDEKTKHRAFEMERSKRLHWVRHHIEEKKQTDILVFSVAEPKGDRTYIYDIAEQYVIVLEPKRNVNEYYLLTAYYVRGKDAVKDKFTKKYEKRRLPNVL